MYLKIGSTLEPGRYGNKTCNDRFELYWEGILFLPGVNAGEESARRLLEDLCAQEGPHAIVENILRLRGNWTLFLRILANDTWIACADHSHQSHLYYSTAGVSSSFLRIREEIADKTRLSYPALLHFLCAGVCHDHRTPYDEIAILDYRDYILISHGKIEVLPKGLPDFLAHKGVQHSFLDGVDRLFGSLRGESLCVDLTAGADSRSFAIALHHLGYDFDVATDGDKDFTEVQTARQVAALLGKEFKQRDVCADELPSTFPRDAWYAGDGLDFQPFSYAFESWRERLGYSCVVSCIAGELYKDAGWYRPALRSLLSTAPVARLIKRMVATGTVLIWDSTPQLELLSMLSSRLRPDVETWLQETTMRLTSVYERYPVLEAADRLFFDFGTNLPAGTKNLRMPRYCPLTEQDLVRVGVNQPIYRRLNHNFYRREIGRLNLQVAGVPTDRIGLTLSPRLRDAPREWWKYLSVLARKLCGLPGRKFKNENRNHTVLTRFLLAHPDLKEAMTRLTDLGIISPDLASPTLNQARRILALHYMLS